MSLTTTNNSLLNVDNDKRKEVFKRTFCKGLSDEEAELYFDVCRRYGLEPGKHVYPVPRWDSKEKRNVMTIQTSIDGLRAIAESTDKYCPGRESIFTYKEDKTLLSATSFVKKQTADGTWHEVSYTAFFEEYAGRTKEGNLNNFWGGKPHIMLAKCAEAMALRKAFPLQLAKIYSEEEMQGPGNKPIEVSEECIDQEELEELCLLVEGRDDLRDKLLAHYKVPHLSLLPKKKYEIAISNLKRKLKEEEDAKDKLTAK